MANPFASLIDKSIAPVVGASGDANPFLQPPVGALGSDNESWTDDDVEPSFLFKPLSTRSRAVPIESIIKMSMTAKRIKTPSSQVGMQCMRGEDGKYYYIPIDPYNESQLKTIIEELSPLLVNPTPSDFQKGALYTYVIVSIITKDPGTGMDKPLVPAKLYACKAQNMFEFGTKHHHIFFRMALTTELANVAQQHHIGMNKVEYALHASGEIKCIRPTRLKFNYFSGTYKMKRKIPPNREMGEQNYVKKLMHSIDPNYVMQFDPKPFIVPETMSITREQLRNLNEKGIPTFGFDTQRQCSEMRYHVLRVKNVEKRTLGLEEMNQKYQLIMNPPPAPPPTNAYAMGRDELEAYAAAVNAAAVKAAAAGECDVPMPIPIPVPPYDKNEFRKIIKAHMDANKGKGGGGKQRTLKKKMMCKKKMTMKKRK
jgi:hypothetical protein